MGVLFFVYYAVEPSRSSSLWYTNIFPMFPLEIKVPHTNILGRQMILPDLGREGQERLKRARVGIVGAGGLGCPIALYLANAGIGFLKIIDSDKVEESNLHRQVLHTVQSIGELKVVSAQRELLARNSSVCVEACGERIDLSNIERILGDVDVVVDGSDNMPTRYLLNDYCIVFHKVRFPNNFVKRFLASNRSIINRTNG